jgi:hypothetical protein
MKKIVLIVFTILLSVSIFGCSSTKSANEEHTGIVKIIGGLQQNTTQVADEPQTRDNAAAAQTSQTAVAPDQSNETDEMAVRSMVEEFGKRLQMVSLLAPKELLDTSMQENYGGLVAPELITQWQNDSQKAPGRMASSPWPDRIEISVINKSPENTYDVKGELIEITSVEKENGGAAAKRPIMLVAEKTGDRWLITSVTIGEYEDKNQITYENIQYGFTFSLPAGWKGYSIVTGQWEGMATDEKQEGEIAATGPIISIRHPEWTSQNPRQDIPIMVFTLDQWKALQQDEFHIGAAPIGPGKIGQNSGCVFAIPARYNYAFPIGYEEVEKILKGNPLKSEK